MHKGIAFTFFTSIVVTFGEKWKHYALHSYWKESVSFQLALAYLIRFDDSDLSFFRARWVNNPWDNEIKILNQQSIWYHIVQTND